MIVAGCRDVEPPPRAWCEGYKRHLQLISFGQERRELHFFPCVSLGIVLIHFVSQVKEIIGLYVEVRECNDNPATIRSRDKPLLICSIRIIWRVVGRCGRDVGSAVYIYI